MKTFRNLFLVLLIQALFSCQNGQNNQYHMDLIIHNAIIYKVDENFALAESAAIKNGKFVAVASNDEILEKYTAEKVIDLQGSYVYPGFIDPHAHFFGYGQTLVNADLTGTRSFEEIIEIIKRHHQDHPYEWVLGRGWDQNEWPVREFPHRDDLDKVFPDVPVLLNRVDGHAAIANTEALNRAGITEETVVSGGRILKEDGRLTGVLSGNAVGLVRQAIPEPGREEQIASLLNAQKNCFEVGLTGIGDAGLDKEVIQLIDSMHQAGDLKMRIYAMLEPSEENFRHYLENGIYQTDHLHIASVKLFADGALGSRGAKLIEPYSDDPENSGYLAHNEERIREIARKTFDHGYQLNTHCIGDSAVRLMLNIYGEFLEKDNDRRWRIEHAQVVHPDDFQLFRQYNIIPSVQTIHATSDMLWAIDRLGPNRLRNAYAYQKLLQQNGWLANGSDFPVEPINPLYGFYAGVARKNLEGKPEHGFQMENALTREQALRAMTIWAAKAQFEENKKGSIEPGKFADFVVTGQNLMQMPLEDIPELKIKKTFLGGEMVFNRD